MPFYAPIISVVVFFAILGGLVALQIYLSRCNNKWLGLILPMCCFIYSIIMVFSMTAFTVVKGPTTQTTIEEDGTITEEIIELEEEPEEVEGTSMGELLPAIFITFILGNIPTIIGLTIYFACRDRMKGTNLVDKMKIKDL